MRAQLAKDYYRGLEESFEDIILKCNIENSSNIMLRFVNTCYCVPLRGHSGITKLCRSNKFSFYLKMTRLKKFYIEHIFTRIITVVTVVFINTKQLSYCSRSEQLGRHSFES